MAESVDSENKRTFTISDIATLETKVKGSLHYDGLAASAGGQEQFVRCLGITHAPTSQCIGTNCK